MPVAKLPVEPFGTAEQASILVGGLWGHSAFSTWRKKQNVPNSNCGSGFSRDLHCPFAQEAAVGHLRG